MKKDNKQKKAIKAIVGCILTLGGLIGLITCFILATAFYFKNPDMTDLRRFIEYPDPTIWAIICLIATQVGLVLGKGK